MPDNLIGAQFVAAGKSVRDVEQSPDWRKRGVESTETEKATTWMML